MRVAWEQMNGKKFEGEFVELDNGTAIVKMDDGSTKAVNAESLMLVSEERHTNNPDETCFCERCLRSDRGGL